MTIPLRWIKNDVENARIAFNQRGRKFFYLTAPVQADFPLSFDSLAPFVTQVLDLAAPLEGCGLMVRLVEIKDGKVKVW